jgi:ABC-type multidrug transport system fused ATPase/permease subunit
MPQSPYLFTTTVEDTIRFSRPDASETDVVAAQAAGRTSSSFNCRKVIKRSAVSVVCG